MVRHCRSHNADVYSDVDDLCTRCSERTEKMLHTWPTDRQISRVTYSSPWARAEAPAASRRRAEPTFRFSICTMLDNFMCAANRACAIGPWLRRRWIMKNIIGFRKVQETSANVGKGSTYLHELKLNVSIFWELSIVTIVAIFRQNFSNEWNEQKVVQKFFQKFLKN